jgi:hypothetical protein
MAMMTIRSTYALDPDTVRILAQLARRWRVSKSEALRRAIRAAAGLVPPGVQEALQALDRLQRDLHLTPARAGTWTRHTRAERHRHSGRPARLG